MDVVKMFKEVISFTQKSNDIDMTQKIISIQQMIIEIQEQNLKLKEENQKLKEKINIRTAVVHYRNVPIISLNDDDKKILYCANCYGRENIFIPLNVYCDGEYICPNCRSHGNASNSPDYERLIEELK